MNIPEPWGRRFNGLGFRLMVLMGAALLPLALLSYVQTLATATVSDSRARAAIMGETLVAAEPQMHLLMQAQGTLTTLAATLPQTIADSDQCSAFVRRVAGQSQGRYSFVGFIPTDGKITCTSADEPFDLSNDAWLADMVANPRARLTVNRNGPISGTSIVNLSMPVTSPDDRLLGFASVSVTHAAIEAVTDDAAWREMDQPLTLVTFDEGGEVLTSSSGIDGVGQVLPANLPLAGFVGRPAASFIASTPTGQKRAFAVIPLSPGSLYLLGSWPAKRLDGLALASGLPPATFPMLMWAASMLVVWLAAESQVLRHVRALRDSITAFAGGNRKVSPLNNYGAANELREAGSAYERMTEAILHDEAHLENTIHQKEVLLREVHHRVKNNLQLIASILNMQLRTISTPEARSAMRSVQERVLSLATIHRELYQTSGLADVRSDELLPRIVRHILRIGSAPERPFALDMQVDDIRLVPDQAVPLALFLTEGMANVLKHTWRGQEGPAVVSLRFLRTADGLAELTVTNALRPRDPAAEAAIEAAVPPSDGFGSKLLEAFARQLDGRIERGRVGDEYRLMLAFQPSPLAQAEERQTPAAAESASEMG